jgi:hypothetical protein
MTPWWKTGPIDYAEFAGRPDPDGADQFLELLTDPTPHSYVDFALSYFEVQLDPRDTRLNGARRVVAAHETHGEAARYGPSRFTSATPPPRPARPDPARPSDNGPT